MNTKKIENNGIVDKGLNKALEYDKLEKVEWTKCLSEDRRVNEKAEGNEVLRYGREKL